MTIYISHPFPPSLNYSVTHKLSLPSEFHVIGIYDMLRIYKSIGPLLGIQFGQMKFIFRTAGLLSLILFALLPQQGKHFFSGKTCSSRVTKKGSDRAWKWNFPTERPTDRVLDHNFLTKTKTFSYCFYSKREKTTNETFWFVYLALIWGRALILWTNSQQFYAGLLKRINSVLNLKKYFPNSRDSDQKKKSLAKRWFAPGQGGFRFGSPENLHFFDVAPDSLGFSSLAFVQYIERYF